MTTPVVSPAVRVTGSSAALGGWDYDKALKLQGEKGNKWQAVLAMPSDEVADFEYKYVADGKHEEGPNRKSDVYDVEPAPEMGDDHVRVSNLKAVFNGMLIRFLMFHPLQHKHERMCITGGHPAFGSWGKPDAWCLGTSPATRRASGRPVRCADFAPAR